MTNEITPEITPYDTSAIKVTSDRLSVDMIIRRLINNEIDMTPLYQRESNPWDDVKKSRFIESLLLRIPVQSLYFNTYNDEMWTIIDGLQRLTTLREVMVEHSLKLRDMEYLPDFDGMTCFPIQFVRRIEETNITCCRVESRSDTVNYSIYRLLH